MEGILHRRSGFGGDVKEERRFESYGDGENIGEVGYGRKVNDDNNSKPNSPNQKYISNNKQDEDQLEYTKAEWSEVRRENERLKTTLARIVNDHQSLQMHLFDIVQQKQAKKSTHTSAHEEVDEEPELVSLSLGRGSSELNKEDKNSNSSKSREDEELKEGLALGLDCKFDVVSKPVPIKPILKPSAEKHFDVRKEEELRQQWPPSKILKTMRSGDNEVAQQTHVKRARVSVRARCDTPTMNDGCHWRKYGQKIAKGNPCPRAYYRCTIAPSCPVRKQVQRCYEDMSILSTTYEGTHNHPLPVSATAMASTTSAAASMLMSGSLSSSRPAIGASTTTTTAANLHGLDFSSTYNLSRSSQIYLPNSSISSFPSHPTITLDLTAPPSSSALQFNDQQSSSNFSMTPRYSTGFNFSSESNSLPTSWGNGYLSHGAQSYNKNHMESLNIERQTQEHTYDQVYMQKNNTNPPQHTLTDTVAAATKVLTSDPTFCSALAAAITSIVGGDMFGPQGKQSGG